MIYRVLIAVTILSTLAGCAKFPSTPPTSGKQLVITLRVRGTISPINNDGDPGALPYRYYFVAIDNDNDNNTGPWAVSDASKGGNGWATSDDAENSVGMTSFIRYDAANPQGYLYRVLPGTNFLNTSPPNPLIQGGVIDGGTTLRFVVDFSQIATDAIPADQIRNLNINFITTNALPVGGVFVPGREWDGLGPTGENPVPVDTTGDNFYQGDNGDGHAVTDPDLDIIYWSVEVQTVSSR